MLFPNEDPSLAHILAAAHHSIPYGRVLQAAAIVVVLHWPAPVSCFSLSVLLRHHHQCHCFLASSCCSAVVFPDLAGSSASYCFLAAKVIGAAASSPPVSTHNKYFFFHRKKSDQKRKQTEAALLSLSVTIFGKLITNHKDLDQLADKIAPGDPAFSFARKLKELVEGYSEQGNSHSPENTEDYYSDDHITDKSRRRQSRSRSGRLDAISVQSLKKHVANGGLHDFIKQPP
ncbi:hypothetical protein ABZP36_034089 [Zizania latifolia]